MIPVLLSSSLHALALSSSLAAATSDRALVRPRTVELRSRPQKAVGAATNSATVEPSVPTFLNATAVFAFNDGVIYHAYAAPGRVTDIILQPGEVLGSVASGDTARWIIGDTTSGVGAEKRAHILVKPFSAGLTTNLVITTDRRTYHVLLTSSGGSAMAAVSWSYPADEMIALRKASAALEAAEPLSSGFRAEDLSFNYAITGDRPAWRPLRVFDDGRQTYVEFPPSLAVGEAPPLFVRGAKGEAQLINYRVRGHFYIVDRLFDVAELRLGTKKQEIVRISRLNSEPKNRGGRR